jgi:hypothetical protein
MKLSDVKYQEYNKQGLQIFIDEDWNNYKWWNSSSYLKYVFTCDKEKIFVHNYLTVGQYLNNEGIGYFAVQTLILLNNVSEFSIYDRYVELLEFGLINNNKKYAEALLNYLIYYSRLNGAKFIKISKRYDEFKHFYSLIEKHNAIFFDNCYYIKITNPIEYEDLIHIKTYSDDSLDINDIVFLHTIGLTVDRNLCYVNFTDGNSLSINRRNGQLTLPKNVVYDSENYKSFNKSLYALIYYVYYNYYSFSSDKFILDYNIKDVNLVLHKLNGKLVSLDDFTKTDYDKTNLLKIKENSNFNLIEIFTIIFDIHNSTYLGCRKYLNINREINN